MFADVKATAASVMLVVNACCVLTTASHVSKLASKIPRLVLFDVDNTLVRSDIKYPRCKIKYIVQAIITVFQTPIHGEELLKFPKPDDKSMVTRLLEHNGVVPQGMFDPVYKTKFNYAVLLSNSLIREALDNGKYKFRMQRNVNNLIKNLAKRDDVKLGILTGNDFENAYLKLRNAQVYVKPFIWGNTPHILFGGYEGSEPGGRSKLVRTVWHRYEKHLEKKVRANDLVIVGDRPEDIKCAHDNDVACVSVTTGRHHKRALRDADHVLLRGFQNEDESVEAILNTIHTPREPKKTNEPIVASN